MATIQKRGKSYRITVSCGYDLEGKQIRASTTWTPDPDMTARQIEKEVNRQAVLFEEQVKTGAVSVNGNIRLKAFSERFLNDYARLYLKPTTIRNYERDLDRINAALGHVRLCDLKPAQITRFYASLMQEGSNQQNGGKLSSATIAAVNRTLSAVLAKAVKWGYLPSSPIKRVDKPKLQHKEARYLDEPDARRMLELLQDEPVKWRCMITFDLFSGLRRGELLGLKWEDIDMDARTLTVQRTLNYLPQKGVYVDSPKSTTSRRPLHLSGTAVALLLAQQAWQNDRRAELGDAWTETGYVFTTDDGNTIFPTSVTTWFREFIRSTGLPYVSVHSLRHTFASLQISDGVPLVVVSRQLGHAKASTTANIYAHVIAEAEAKADQTFDRFSDVIQPNKHQTNTKAADETETA